MKAKYLYRIEFASKEEGFRPIMIRINEPNIEGYPKLITLSCGRFFFPFSSLDLPQIINRLITTNEALKKLK